MGIADDLAQQIKAEFEKMGKQPGSLEELNKMAAMVNQRYNDSPLPNFEGLSPSTMHQVIDFPFGDKCPVKINQALSDDQLLDSPLIHMTLNLLSIINESNGLKLTDKGNLPRKVVFDIYSFGYFGSKQYDNNIKPKVLNETDYLPLHLCNLLLKVSGNTKVTKGKLVLTTSGKKCLNNSGKLFADMLLAFCTKFNKAYFDAFPNQEIGNLGVVYILYLLAKFGDQKRESSFYSDKYFKAFTMLKEEKDPKANITPLINSNDFLVIRLFDRGFRLFGLIDVENSRADDNKNSYLVKTTKLFKSSIIVE